MFCVYSYVFERNIKGGNQQITLKETQADYQIYGQYVQLLHLKEIRNQAKMLHTGPLENKLIFVYLVTNAVS